MTDQTGEFQTWRDPSRMRTLLILAAFAIFACLIAVRVVQVQIVRSHELEDKAVAERLVADTVPARRGNIYDARGTLLATDLASARVWAILGNIEDRQRTAELLAPLLGQPVDELVKTLNTPDVEWLLIARQIDPEVVSAIEALDLEGIYLEPEPLRYYPNGDFAAHVLGFTNVEHEGNYGVEGGMDDVVGGDEGTLVAERDGAGNVIALTQSYWDPPKDGSDLVLTIDSSVQMLIERVLEETVKEQRAKGGSIIVQDPKTGAILGMANWPTYDPNEYSAEDDIGVFTNPAISRVYEPGSTFKSIVMAIGIDDGVVTADSTFNDAPGYREIPDHPPITNNNGAVWGIQTMTEVLVRSSNLGAIYVAEQIGAERLYQRLTQFGIGKLSGIELQGQERGILTKPWESDWNETLFFTNAFGQGIAITPLQIVNAYSAIVNGGYLMEPHIVAEEHQTDGTVVKHEPHVVREIISEESSATMREMLHQVVERRVDHYPQVPGYNIGAKTGTAQVPSPDGGYVEDTTIASIVGFGPVEDPQFVVLVKIDEPQETPWGETAAGPALGEILRELFLLYGIQPTEAE
ncbi:MAG: penicillin-binding protein 2 [Thermomicrobiales bacterium]